MRSKRREHSWLGVPLHERVILPVYHDELLLSVGSGRKNKRLRLYIPLIQGRGIPDKNVPKRNKKFPHGDMRHMQRWVLKPRVNALVNGVSEDTQIRPVPTY